MKSLLCLVVLASVVVPVTAMPAVGTTGTVYLSIPGHRTGSGKVHITVQNRLVEVQAVTAEDALPTGSPILVVDVQGNDTVVVVRNPILLNEVSNAGA